MSTPVDLNGGHVNQTTKALTRPARVRCEHPSCRKYGHTVAECWKAHPELRSRDNRKLPYRPQRAKAPSCPFLFLDLPAELQNRIYEAAYAEPYTLTASCDHEDPVSPVHFRKSWPTNLHLANKKTYQDSKFLRDNFSGRLRCFAGPISSFNRDSNWDELRSRVKKLTFFGFTPVNMNQRIFGYNEWDYMHVYFPAVEEIHVEWTKTSFKFLKGSRELSEGWKNLSQPGGHQAFLAGEMDAEPRFNKDCVDYRKAWERLKMWNLVNVMEEDGRDYKIFVTGILQWLGHGRKVVYAQNVKAQWMTTGELEVVDRWAESF